MPDTIPQKFLRAAAWLLLTAACLPSAMAAFESAPDGVLPFTHFNGMTGELYFPEMMGAGAALFDYDNDGDLDVYLVQGNMLGPGKRAEQALLPPPGRLPLSDGLFRNDSRFENGRVELKFTDVTEQAGIRATGYGMGVAVGDIDNDGWVDLYVTNFGANQLWRNRGDGGFEDLTAKSASGDTRWSVSAAFLDFDRDGLLDLYVGNYVDFDFQRHKPCRSTTSARDYCSPLAYRPEPDRLLRNLGGGRFEDVTQSSGIGKAFGGALGVVAADFNDDGWLDVYVANDGSPNQLWMNRGGGRFEDTALLAGVAVNMQGAPEASMGVDAGDFDGDGDLDLFMTHLTRETNTLYINDGQGWFEDKSAPSGLAGLSFAYTGFGTAWFDYDRDGRLDLLAANGAVTRIESQLRAGDPFPLRQRNQLFRNLGAGAFEEIGTRAGQVFQLAEVSRGAAFGDIDNDGDTDVLITNNSGPARLLINHAAPGRAWLGVRLLDAAGKRDMYGARAALHLPGGNSLWRRVRADGSYASANDTRIIFGLGDKPATAYRLEVVWPDGRREVWDKLPPGRYHSLRQGSGSAPNNQGKSERK